MTKGSRYVKGPTPGDIARWVQQLEDEYLCAISLRVDANRPGIPRGSVRVVAEVALPSNGVLEPRVYRSHRTLPPRSSVDTTEAAFRCLMEAGQQMELDPQSKFWRLEGGNRR